MFSRCCRRLECPADNGGPWRHNQATSALIRELTRAPWTSAGDASWTKYGGYSESCCDRILRSCCVTLWLGCSSPPTERKLAVNDQSDSSGCKQDYWRNCTRAVVALLASRCTTSLDAVVLLPDAASFVCAPKMLLSDLIKVQPIGQGLLIRLISIIQT